jgi:hypothetical protein
MLSRVISRLLSKLSSEAELIVHPAWRAFGLTLFSAQHGDSPAPRIPTVYAPLGRMTAYTSATGSCRRVFPKLAEYWRGGR